ncbi:hypothetical protein [Paenirhodobacter populi]|uniref:Uncharacterized protein n=1 Tax=Paenirhodobacter populi TaxID=2306993 RepID=A0A443JRD9_9RHOB|nr:hypothetical protein [Sinirhodobacter populi]RWR23084.1 hypothetical protein D2T30_05540 [Sinirhodobacter populi]
MAEYTVILKDRDGFDICTALVDGLPAAKARARYLLSDEHAAMIGTTHDDLGTYKVEVQSNASGVCLWDAFRCPSPDPGETYEL